MKIHYTIRLICLLLTPWFGMSAASADSGADSATQQAEVWSFDHGLVGDGTFVNAAMVPTSSNFELAGVEGFTEKRIAGDFRVRGWRVKKGMYLGQTKVSDTWGLGLVYEIDNTFYGVNHRGIQVLKKF